MMNIPIKNTSGILFTKQIRPNLILIVGSNALDLFDHLEVDYLHGLNRFDCAHRIAEGGTYIDGMCNYFPNNQSKHYLFLNKQAFKENMVENYGLIFHETLHYAFENILNNDNDNTKNYSRKELFEAEEMIVTETEIVAIDIFNLLFIGSKSN